MNGHWKWTIAVCCRLMTSFFKINTTFHLHMRYVDRLCFLWLLQTFKFDPLRWFGKSHLLWLECLNWGTIIVNVTKSVFKGSKATSNILEYVSIVCTALSHFAFASLERSRRVSQTFMLLRYTSHELKCHCCWKSAISKNEPTNDTHYWIELNSPLYPLFIFRDSFETKLFLNSWQVCWIWVTKTTEKDKNVHTWFKRYF